MFRYDSIKMFLDRLYIESERPCQLRKCLLAPDVCLPKFLPDERFPCLANELLSALKTTVPLFSVKSSVLLYMLRRASDALFLYAIANVSVIMASVCHE